MPDISTAAKLIGRAEDCSEFHRFCDQFSTWEIQCWLGPKEKALHFGMGAFNEGGSNLLEIGTLEGASALFTMAGLRHRGIGKLYSVDPHLGAPPFLGAAPWQFTLDKFRANAKRAGLENYVHSLVSDSQIASSVWPALALDSVLIDGDHSYEGCLRDVECWATKLKPDGFLLIDDADDPALPELLNLVEELKRLEGLRFEALVEGVAVFRRADIDGFSFLRELKALPSSKRRRPWDMEFVQNLVPKANYMPDKLQTTLELLAAYQLGFLARCEPGDYAITASAPPSDVEIVDALISARKDGSKAVVDPWSPLAGRYRMVVCSIEEAPMLASSLLPGGVLIARSAKPVTYENSIAERTALLDAGLEGCGWQNQIHWAFARPHFLSMDAVVSYIEENMEPRRS